MKIDDVARVCHEANRGLCESVGDMTQRSWEAAEQWQRDSAIRGVTFALANPDAPASAQHDAWLADKRADGWIYGEMKDPIKKTHPCMVEYLNLSNHQKAKDYLFKGIVSSLRSFVKI